jgi:hypothetical protein
LGFAHVDRGEELRQKRSNSHGNYLSSFKANEASTSTILWLGTGMVSTAL